MGEEGEGTERLQLERGWVRTGAQDPDSCAKLLTRLLY